jgi:hypothetical protein
MIKEQKKKKTLDDADAAANSDIWNTLESM